MYVPVCSEPGEWQSVPLTALVEPRCPTGLQQWVSVEQLAPPPWWSYEIPGEQIADLFTAMFLFAAVVMVCVQVDKAIGR